jgi:hypothetical protein
LRCAESQGTQAHIGQASLLPFQEGIDLARVAEKGNVA